MESFTRGTCRPLGECRAELWYASRTVTELIEAFRQYILLPRRAIVRSIVERGQARGDVRDDIDPEAGLELTAGPFLTRVSPAWAPGP